MSDHDQIQRVQASPTATSTIPADNSSQYLSLATRSFFLEKDGQASKYTAAYVTELKKSGKKIGRDDAIVIMLNRSTVPTKRIAKFILGIASIKAGNRWIAGDILLALDKVDHGKVGPVLADMEKIESKDEKQAWATASITDYMKDRGYKPGPF